MDGVIVEPACPNGGVRKETNPGDWDGAGLLSMVVPAAKCETTARGAASSFKDQGVFMPPRLEANVYL